MHYPDLSLYKHHLQNELGNVRNVGWLSAEFAMPLGAVEPKLLDLLKQAFLGVARFEAEAVLIRGANHCCEICGARPGIVEMLGKKKPLGVSEIWIPGEGGLHYAAPSLIIHYIEEHNYLPPDEFLKAISAIDFDLEYSAETVWRNCILEQ